MKFLNYICNQVIIQLTLKIYNSEEHLVSNYQFFLTDTKV